LSKNGGFGANAQSFAANERRTAERYRPASGSDQLKSAFFRHHFFFAPVALATPGSIHEIYQLMRRDLPFLDTYPDKYYFLLNNERKTCDRRRTVCPPPDGDADGDGGAPVARDY
jgi:hypothetical protein